LSYTTHRTTSLSSYSIALSACLSAHQQVAVLQHDAIIWQQAKRRGSDMTYCACTVYMQMQAMQKKKLRDQGKWHYPSSVPSHPKLLHFINGMGLRMG